VARGRRLYWEGRYIESADLLARNENRLVDETPRRQAEYATYRGLSNLVLGNYPEAHRWMAYAYAIEQRAPGTLRAEFRADLDRGWGELMRRMGIGPAPQPVAGAPRPAAP
jgi:hypothetical protein